MEDKITSINEVNAPIDRDILLEKLQQIPEGVVRGYLEAISKNVDEILDWKQIFSASPSAAKHLIEKLDQTRLEELNTIVVCLLSKNPLEHLRELREITFGVIDPLEGSYERGVELINLIKFCSVNYNEEILKIATEARRLGSLAGILVLLGFGQEFEGALISELARTDLSEILGMIDLFKERREAL